MKIHNGLDFSPREGAWGCELSGCAHWKKLHDPVHSHAFKSACFFLTEATCCSHWTCPRPTPGILTCQRSSGVNSAQTTVTLWVGCITALCLNKILSVFLTFPETFHAKNFFSCPVAVKAFWLKVRNCIELFQFSAASDPKKTQLWHTLQLATDKKLMYSFFHMKTSVFSCQMISGLSFLLLHFALLQIYYLLCKCVCFCPFLAVGSRGLVELCYIKLNIQHSCQLCTALTSLKLCRQWNWTNLSLSEFPFPSSMFTSFRKCIVLVAKTKLLFLWRSFRIW